MAGNTERTNQKVGLTGINLPVETMQKFRTLPLHDEIQLLYACAIQFLGQD
jgi:hypothetical protein